MVLRHPIGVTPWDPPLGTIQQLAPLLAETDTTLQGAVLGEPTGTASLQQIPLELSRSL